MPLHEYECDVCGRRFEKIQKFSDPPIEVCPTCGGHVHKLISSPAFQFKGSGWYVTDYGKKDTTGTDKTEAKSSSDSKESSGAAKSEGSSDKDAGGKKSETPAASASAPSESSTTTSTKPAAKDPS